MSLWLTPSDLRPITRCLLGRRNSVTNVLSEETAQDLSQPAPWLMAAKRHFNNFMIVAERERERYGGWEDKEKDEIEGRKKQGVGGRKGRGGERVGGREKEGAGGRQREGALLPDEMVYVLASWADNDYAM